MKENALREALVMHGRSLYERGFAHGSSGNLSVRLADGLLITPTNSCLGRLDPARISKVDGAGKHVSGDAPSKESFLHLAMYEERPAAESIVPPSANFSIAAVFVSTALRSSEFMCSSMMARASSPVPMRKSRTRR